MTRILTIALKDLRIAFRDTSSLIMMLLTPFALTLAIGFAFGGFGGGAQTTLQGIPVYIINKDDGQFGEQLVSIFTSPDLAELIDPSLTTDEAAARAAVDADQAAALVLIPTGLSESILPSHLLQGAPPSSGNIQPIPSQIEIYSNPTRPNSSGVVRSIVDRYLSQVAAGASAGQTTVTQLVMSGRLAPQEAGALGQEIGSESGRRALESRLLVLRSEGEAQTGSGPVSYISYMATSMAVLFLMFTVTTGGRSILAERQGGTLPRLLTTPLTPLHVLTGKSLGIFLTGLAQLGILIAAMTLLLNIYWGDWRGVAALTVALALAAASWGLLIAAFSRSPAQASIVGTTISLVFAAGAGNFVDRSALPNWLQQLSLISPNAWGLEGYASLLGGGSLTDISGILFGLLVMAILLTGLSSLAFIRQYR